MILWITPRPPPRKRALTSTTTVVLCLLLAMSLEFGLEGESVSPPTSPILSFLLRTVGASLTNPVHWNAAL